MADDTQQISKATQEVTEAASNLIDAVYNLFNEIVKVVSEVIESVVEWCSSVYKQIKKYNCNNWRRMHGLPLIHRNKNCRQGRMFHQLL